MTEVNQQTDTGWQAQVLRLTAFLTSPLDPSVAQEMWKETVGTDPETDDNRPREGVRRQIGAFGDGQLEVGIAPDRVDWILSPKAPPNIPPTPHFASLEKAMSLFVEQGKSWLQIGNPSIHRLAVGAVLLMPTRSKDDAYGKLGSFLKMVQVDPVNSSELFYQINWRRQSAVMPSLQLNRMTRWNALQMGSINIQIARAVLQSTPIRSAPFEEEHFCAVECDHNTAGDWTRPFSPSQAGSLFQELCDLVVDNARNGEVPTKA